VINTNIYFRIKLSYVDKISDSEEHVAEKIMELADQMQILRQNLI
jgi:hypothetical protein